MTKKINKEQTKSELECTKSQSNNNINPINENDTAICLKFCLSAPYVTGTLENELSKLEEPIAVQKSISEPIKLEYKESQNYNAEETNSAIQPNPALVDKECEKQQKKYDEETEPNPSQVITKDQNQSELQRVEYKINEKENDIANKTEPIPHFSKCTKIESKPYVKRKNCNKEERKQTVQILPTPSDLVCIKRQIKYESEKETAAQTKYMQYINTSKEQIDVPYAKNQSNNNNSSMHEIGKTICMKFCPSAPCATETLENEYAKRENAIAVEKSTSAPIKLESVTYQNYNVEETDIGIQSNPAQYIPIIKEQKQTEPKYVEYQNNIEAKQALQSHFPSTDPENRKRQIESQLCCECENYNEEEKNAVQRGPAKTHSEYLRMQIKYEKENETTAEKSTSALNILECEECQNYNTEEKDIGIQTNPAHLVTINKEQNETNPEYVENQQKYDEEKDIGVQTNPSQYVITKSQKRSKPQSVEYPNSNKDKISPATTTSVLILPECVECNNYYEEKNIGVQTNPAQYATISKEQKLNELKYVEYLNNNMGKSKIATEPSPPLITPEYVKNVNQYVEETNTDVQTHSSHYFIKTRQKQNKINEEVASSAPTNPNCLKEKKEYDVQKYNPNQTKYRNISKEQIESKSHDENQNCNEKRTKNALRTGSAPTDTKALKRQTKFESEKETSSQTKCMQYRNISKEQIKYKLRQNYNEEEKETAVLTNPAPSDQECLKKKTKYEIEKEKENAAQTKYMQYKNISKEQIDIPCVRSQCDNNNNIKTKEIVIRPSSALISPECLKCKNKIEEEKNIGVQSKYMQYRNIAKERKENKSYVNRENYNEDEKNISAQKSCAPTQSKCFPRQTKYKSDKKAAAQTKYIQNQNNNSKEKEIDIQPCPKLTGLECIKRQIKNAEEKNTSVQGKYIQYKNIENVKSETISSKCCPFAPCNEENLVNESGVQESISAPIRQKFIEYQNKEQQKEIAVKPNSSLTGSECLKRRKKYDIEKETASQTRYIKLRDISKEQIECKPCNKCSNYKEEEIAKQTNQNQNKANYDVTFQKCDKQEESHEINKTCNNQCSNYVTPKDYSKPKNFQHLFTRKNYSQYITRDESISSTLHGCSRTCSRYMSTVDYNKPEGFAHLFSTSKLSNSEYSKLIKSPDNYFEKDPFSQNSKSNDCTESTKKYTFEVTSKVTNKDEKSVSDDDYLMVVKKRNSKGVINSNNTSTIYQCAKKCIENRSILKNIIYPKIKPQKPKASEKSSSTSTYDMIRNMFLKN